MTYGTYVLDIQKRQVFTLKTANFYLEPCPPWQARNIRRHTYIHVNVYNVFRYIYIYLYWLPTLVGTRVGPARNGELTTDLFKCSETDRERLARRRLRYSETVRDGLFPPWQVGFLSQGRHCRRPCGNKCTLDMLASLYRPGDRPHLGFWHSPPLFPDGGTCWRLKSRQFRHK